MKEEEKYKRKIPRNNFFYLAIVIVAILFILLTFNGLLGDFGTKIITTILALVSAIAFWLQFDNKARLDESSYIMNLNNQFISNKDMSFIEHELELYYNQYAALYNSKYVDDFEKEISNIHLGLNLSRSSEECQKLINYLVYLEALAAMVENEVIHLDIIDNLFSYRFFIAVNNPVVQENELFPYADYYKGIFNLSERWIDNHKHPRKKFLLFWKKKPDPKPIPMEEYCLTRSNLLKWEEKDHSKKYEYSFAKANDNKAEIAGCLYDTDPFIYPEAFGENRDVAVKIISRIIGMQDSLLAYKNIIVARYNGQVCGICLMSDGNSKWDVEDIKRRVGGDLMTPSMAEGFEYASKEYFSNFVDNNFDDSSVELVACCVEEGFRGNHIADGLLNKVITDYGDKTIRLAVLSDNAAAIGLYEKYGFRIKAEEKGFASKGLEKPKCYVMERQANKEHSQELNF